MRLFTAMLGLLFVGLRCAVAEDKTTLIKALEAFQRADLDAAREQFQIVLKNDPANLVGLVNLGAVEYRARHFEAAEPLLKKALRIEIDTAAAWLTLGAIYFEQDKLDAALAALAQATLLEPKNARAHNYLGVTIGKKGWLSGAEMELQRAIELEPDYAEAHFNLALIYLRRDPRAIELARRHYKKAVSLGAAPDLLVEKTLAGVSESPTP
jgi:tetratricopeptide (TPR) repeat protein